MTPGVRLVVLGKQGAGKGTQCVRLSHYYAVPHISTGDMLRANVRTKTPLGLDAKARMDRGELLPDTLIMDMVRERLQERNVSARGFILDGCPRTVVQAEILAEMLAPMNLDLVVELDVPTELVLERIASRRVCTDCGHIYSTGEPPVVKWVCDVCGGNVVQRDDDTEEAVLRRLAAYEAETAPLADWYRAHDLLTTIDGVGSPDDVLARTIEAIESRRGWGRS